MKSWGQSKKKSAEFAAPAAGWDAPQDRLFAVLLALALLLRLWLAVRGHAIRHPDEVFQGLEQAHRMVFGYGVPTIEMARHLRAERLLGVGGGPDLGLGAVALW